jgi:ADP-ribose pyrophosphatase
MSSEPSSEDVSSEEVFKGSLITVRVETLSRPIGGVTRIEVVEHPDSVAIVALRLGDMDGADGVNGAVGGGSVPYVALVRQPRPAIGRETWELPAGLVHDDERDDPERAAARELREETGYAATAWQRLAREYPSPGFSTEAITIYLATQVYPTGGAPDPTEIAALEWVPLAAALERARGGAIEDGKTLLGLALAAQVAGQTPGQITGQSTGGAATASTGGDSMPRDTADIPLRRTPRLDEDVQPGGALSDTLKLDGLLLEEFNYAGTSAYQAMEDRARMFNLYLVIVGVLGAALGAMYQFGGANVFTQPLTATLLAVAGIIGIVFFVQLVRLRQAHQDSIITMNMIKEYYLARFTPDNPNIGQVFQWRLNTVKVGERLGSVTFLIGFTVALLDGLCFAGAAYIGYLLFLGPGIDALAPATVLTGGGIALGVVALVILVQILNYRSALSRRKEQTKLDRAAQKVAQAVATAERPS